MKEQLEKLLGLLEAMNKMGFFTVRNNEQKGMAVMALSIRMEEAREAVSLNCN